MRGNAPASQEELERMLQSVYSAAAHKAFKKLLDECHLYQTVVADISGVENIISSQCDLISVPPPPIHRGSSSVIPRDQVLNSLSQQKRHHIELQSEQIKKGMWEPHAEGLTLDRGSSKAVLATTVTFSLPSIRLNCVFCKTDEPHNPGSSGVWGNVPAYVTFQGGIELHLIPFQCQACKKEPIVFMFRREGVKIRMVGRTPMEPVNVSKVIPEPESEFYRDAVLAFQCGQVLPALFMLRTFIEQIWKRYSDAHNVVLKAGVITAEERGGPYQESLPADFRQRFPSFLRIYSDLSAAMHEANPDSELFNRVADEIVQHFEARRVFRLELPSAESSQAGSTA